MENARQFMKVETNSTTSVDKAVINSFGIEDIDKSMETLMEGSINDLGLFAIDNTLLDSQLESSQSINPQPKDFINRYEINQSDEDDCLIFIKENKRLNSSSKKFKSVKKSRVEDLASNRLVSEYDNSNSIVVDHSIELITKSWERDAEKDENTGVASLEQFASEEIRESLTKDECHEIAAKYTTRKSFQQYNPLCYKVSVDNDWIDEICYHMNLVTRLPIGYWNKVRCQAEASKYSSKSEFQKCSVSAYNASHRNQWLDEICSHMTNSKRSVGLWTREKCQVVALKYSTKSEFVASNACAYNAAYKHGWLEEICSHMSASSRLPPGNCYVSCCMNMSNSLC